jgi:tetratricopeptide (TPR) repeat protein
MFLTAASVVLVLANAQPSVQTQRISPYLDAVRRYGPGTERDAIIAIHAMRLRDPDQVFEELDGKTCAAVGARSCRPQHLIAAGGDGRAKVATAWRRLYPRALALHVEALATSDPTVDGDAIRLHHAVILRLIGRIDQIARDERDHDFGRFAGQGRRLLLWTLQYLLDREGLAHTVEIFETAKIQDLELRLARGALEELRTLPDAVAWAAGIRNVPDVFARAAMVAKVERRQLEIAAQVYEDILVEHPSVLEAHLRLAHLLLRLDRVAPAEAHLGRVAELKPDARQAYLAALFLADVYERQGRSADAIAAYEVARSNWPLAQAARIGLSRLRALAGAHAEARTALDGLHLERTLEAPERSDPWNGFVGAQGWRLPAAVAELQAAFKAEP